LSSSDDIAVRLLAGGEASRLIGLIRSCYGETYIDPSFYVETAVRELLADRRLYSIGAFTGAGRLVGHMGISVRARGGNTADAGMTLVDPEFRGKGIARRVAVGLADQSIALGLVGVHDYPVTVHAATQRIGAGFGVDTGLMLANMPGDVSFQGMKTPAPGARTSSLIRWLPFGRAPERGVYLPERYRESLESLYAAAHLSRQLLQPEEGLGEQASELEHAYDPRRRILRIAVARAGRDLVARVADEKRAAAERGGLVAHVDLALSDPATHSATEALRAQGFSFAGLLPEYREGDTLRLQWLADTADDTAFSVLFNDSTRAIAALVERDRISISAAGDRH
jgi:GNAT superfamily N-acetyltransferase